jgi:hypothetical protein
LGEFLQISTKIKVHFPNKWGDRERIPWERPSQRDLGVRMARPLDRRWRLGKERESLGNKEEKRKKKGANAELV